MPIRILLTALFLAHLAIFAWPAGGAAQEAEPFVSSRLLVAGRVVQVVPADVDGDERKDLVVVYVPAERPPRRVLSVFLSDAEGRFPPQPTRIWFLAGDAAYFDVGDVTPAPGREIALIAASDLRIYSVTGEPEGESLRPADWPSTLLAAEEDDLPPFDFIRDWNLDGKEEVLIPGFDRLEFFLPPLTAASRAEAVISAPVRAFIRSESEEHLLGRNYSLSVAYWLPQLLVRRPDPAASPVTLAIWEDQVWIYRGNADTGLPNDTPQLHEFQLIDEVERARRNYDLNVVVEDLDGDGRLDAVLSKTVGGVANRNSSIRVFLGRDGWGEAARPSWRRDVEKAASGALVRDVNDDGLFDLILPRMETGIWSYARLLAGRELKLSFDFFLMRPDGRYPQQPSYERQIAFKFDLGEGVVEGFLPLIDADFNGDGMEDILFGPDGQTLSVILQKPDKTYDDQPDVSIRVPVSKQVLAEDLDGDGRSEVILSYPALPGRAGEILILHNRGTWPPASAPPSRHTRVGP